MDRHNNAIGSVIGSVARTPLEVVERARLAIENGRKWGGRGHNNTSAWLGRCVWEDPGADGNPWPVIQWPDLGSTPHFRPYPGRDAPSLYGSAAEKDSKCPVSVAPHVRDGHPVRGHMRSCPSD